VSPDASLLAYATDADGSERYTLRIRDLDAGADLPDEVPDTYYGVAWSGGGVVFYTRVDDAMRPWQLWRHAVGTPTSDDVLVRRYEATRRKHPLGGTDRVSEAIADERALLEPLKAQADLVVDTSSLNVHELRDRLRDLFATGAADQALQTSIVSFGFKHGLPLDVDLVFDCRFLPNPHWVESLRPLPGTDPRVRRYVLKQPETEAFLQELERLFALLLPAYVREGKAYLSIAVGCTGGHHRSVVLAEELAKVLERLGFEARVHHRDVDRG
jgi:UPF0042 nucleotide-binding protein